MCVPANLTVNYYVNIFFCKKKILNINEIQNTTHCCTYKKVTDVSILYLIP